jgi:hypothetical protein
MIDAQAIALGIGILEQATLRQAIFGCLDAGDHVAGRGCGLFGSLEKIIRHPVHCKLADVLRRNQIFRPGFSGIQRIEIETVQLCRIERLYVQIPNRMIAVGDVAIQILGHVIETMGLNVRRPIFPPRKPEAGNV